MATPRRQQLFWLTSLLSAGCFLFSGCLEFKSIQQPSSVLPGEILTVRVEVVVEHDVNHYSSPYFGICLPDGWTIPSDTLHSTGAYSADMVYDSNIASEQESLSPAPEGYYWWVGVGRASGPVRGLASCEIQIKVDRQTGLYFIDYMLGTSELFTGLNYVRSDGHLVYVAVEATPRSLELAVEGGSVSLSWVGPARAEGLVGYNVCRDGRAINTSPISETVYRDEQVTPGLYSYCVSSLYDDGGEYFLPYDVKSVVFAEGAGRPNAPYHITSADQLVYMPSFPDLLDKHYILVTDIDLSPEGSGIFGEAVIPNFSGVFDGNGHTISNLTIMGESHLGLFGRLLDGAKIRNLGIVNAEITGSGDYIGGLVGENLGELVGCTSMGTIKGNDFVGGLVGHNGRDGHIRSCYSTAATAGIWCVGGLVGGNDGTVITCYSAGAVSPEESGGGLVGGGDFGNVVISSLWDMNASGVASSSGGVGMTTAQMMMGSTFLGWGACGNNGVWTLEEGRDYPRLWWENKPGEPITMGATLSEFLAGTGTNLSPYLIYTADELNLIDKFPCDWDKHFKLMADVDLSGLPYETALIARNVSTSNSRFGGTPFTGVFYGNGHTIAHLAIEGKSYLGLFGEIGSGAVVRDLGLVEASITGSGDYIGALVGHNNGGNISGCYCVAEVAGNENVGGLIGSNDGSVARSHSAGTISGEKVVGGLVGSSGREFGTITRSHSNSSVRGQWYVGGLVGTNEGLIAMSQSTGIVDGGRGYVGGLTGRNTGTITMSSSAGSASASGTVGGLVGGNDGHVAMSFSGTTTTASQGSPSGLVGSNWGSITTSYSTGVSKGGKETGGLVGNNWGSVIGSFWNVETSGLNGSDGGVGLTTAEMQDINTYLDAGWDLVDETGNGTCDYWQMVAGDYPKLRYSHSDSPAMPEGLGTAEEPYLIRDARDLGTVWFDPTAHYCLQESLDLSGITWSMAVVPWFSGTLEGSGRVIRNLRIRGGSNLGLFGQLGAEARISDLNLEDVDVTGTDSGVGGLTGGNRGMISNCYITGTVSGGTSVGGLVGWNGGSIINCHVASKISGMDICGGLVGSNRGKITESHSTGSATGGGTVGGLAGGNYRGTIVNSYSTTNVQGYGILGGLVGNVYQGLVRDCYSTGPVDGNSVVGGLVGFCEASENAAPMYTVISRCYSVGLVKGQSNVGGLVGENWVRGCVASCFWNIETSGLLVSDEGIGKATEELQTATTFLGDGWDFSDETANGTEDIWWILEGQDYPRLWWERPISDEIFLVVDDFESYNDIDPPDPASHRVFDVWIDGYDNPEINGSIVGSYNMESLPNPTTIVRSGGLSMWYSYDNTIGNSWATANTDNLAIGWDWTKESVGILSLWFRGYSYNAAEPMYVALANANGSAAAVYHANPNAAQLNAWTEWTIDLQEFANQGVDLTNVSSITIGFGNRTSPVAGGEGEIWFDDIRLHQ